MNKTDRGILYGMSLGDGGIYTIKDQSPNTARMVIGHSPKQRDYLQHKADLLHSIFGGKVSKINEYKSLNKKMNKVYTNVQICRTEKYFRQMLGVLYATGQKKFTRQVLDYLTDEGLALWYMDDGSGDISWNTNKAGVDIAGGCRTRIATYCSMHEAEIIRDWFKDKYNIDVLFDLDKRNNKMSIRMNTANSKLFVPIVAPYIHESMLYKIQHVDNHVPRVRSTLPKEGDDIVHLVIGEINTSFPSSEV